MSSERLLSSDVGLDLSCRSSAAPRSFKTAAMKALSGAVPTTVGLVTLVLTLQKNKGTLEPCSDSILCIDSRGQRVHHGDVAAGGMGSLVVYSSQHCPSPVNFTDTLCTPSGDGSSATPLVLMAGYLTFALLIIWTLLVCTHGIVLQMGLCTFTQRYNLHIASYVAKGLLSTSLLAMALGQTLLVTAPATNGEADGCQCWYRKQLIVMAASVTTPIVFTLALLNKEKHMMLMLISGHDYLMYEKQHVSYRHEGLLVGDHLVYSSGVLADVPQTVSQEACRNLRLRFFLVQLAVRSAIMISMVNVFSTILVNLVLWIVLPMEVNSIVYWVLQLLCLVLVLLGLLLGMPSFGYHDLRQILDIQCGGDAFQHFPSMQKLFNRCYAFVMDFDFFWDTSSAPLEELRNAYPGLCWAWVEMTSQ